MIISHKHKFVLLSPWKNASSTTYEALKEYDESPYDRFFYFNRYLNRVVHRHITLAEFLLLPESKFGYTLCAFVRNPYDRAYSGFVQLQRDVIDQPRAEYPSAWIKELVTAQLVENQKKIIEADYEFNKWILLLREYEIRDIGRNTNMFLHPSNYWTHIDGQQRVDFIGRVEQFDRDFSLLCSNLGVIAAPIASINVTEEQVGSNSQYRHISKMSKDAITRINELFRDDFELFGYEMIT